MGNNYSLYFDDDYLRESVDNYSEAAKEGVYKDNYIYRDKIQNKYVHPILANESAREKIIEFTGVFRDDHNQALSTSGPVHTFIFGDNETKFFYDLFGTSSEAIMTVYDEVIKETYDGKISLFLTGLVKNAPHKILLVAILIDAIQNNYEDIIQCSELLWGYCEYPMIYNKYWEFGVKEDVMDYTMEHLGSKYKFVQKKMKTIGDLLKYHIEISILAMKERLKTGADNTYMDFIYRVRSQINNSFRNISNEYYENHKHNRTLHKKSSTFDDGSLADQEGFSANLAQIVNHTIDKFASSEVNTSLVKVCAESNKVDIGNLKGFIVQIFAVKNNRMTEFLESVITSFFDKNPTASSVNGNEFFSFGVSLYRSLAGSKLPLYIKIREILNLWMYDIINIKKMYNNSGTIINYTRAIFNYMILMIIHYN